MTIHSIYNKSLETRTELEPPITYKMTEDDYARLAATTKPAKDSGGKVIRPPTITPYKVSENKGTPKAGKDKKERRPRSQPKFAHITKEFMKEQFALGKTIPEIAKEQGMSKYFLLKKCRDMGIGPPKKLRGEKLAWH